MAWQGSRYKTFNSGDPFTPTDANAMQDMFLRPNGIVLADLASSVPLPPIGTILPYSGSADPNALWMVCDGRAISRTAYAGAFAVLGTAYGTGDGSSTFNIPNHQDRIPVGKGATAKTDTVGKVGGEGTHPLTTTEMPAHHHTGTTGDISALHNHNINFGTILYAGGPTARNFMVTGAGTGSSTGAANQDHQHFLSMNNTGSGTAHQNMQPYLTVTHIIRVL